MIELILTYAIAILMACFLIASFSGLYLIFFSLKPTNEMLKHPYLSMQPFHRFSLSVRCSILLDYFFRLFFPNVQFWLIGHANRILPHVIPSQVPVKIKWPLLGLWGCCFIGILCMCVVWGILLTR
ncbi:hypothetical protein KU392_06940 [Advenella alkanexedens]|jgi:hypothetical protein|uniref:Uncharacterized protein n=1 Tax=Advenella alkanexedens TaxID=1481665 RepID=A0ABS6NN42_9BURK|nr:MULTISPECIES: hypothetical protein [Advenella]MBV4396990.1 hypothetical protein [Advenella alkanexedens]MDD3756682.1 hypothetical protein [Advenella sp.]NLN68137.1 hypothetical protein [Alcaligenaceae bacterium]WKU20553.1 hypothetical protein Q3V95_05960 [Advenella alkanexedens]